MRSYTFLSFILAFALLVGCNKPERVNPDRPSEPDKPATGIPEGYFVVTFGNAPADDITKAAISGKSGRVRQLRYIVYNKETNAYVKDRVVLNYADGQPIWPLPVVRDTLPKGEYKAVFVANVEKSFFPYGSPPVTQEVLLNYKTDYSSARIALPPAQFSDSTEYYSANVTFSNDNPNPTVLLQRIIGLVNVHRNFVDAQQALDALTHNIVTAVDYKNYIRTTVNGVLPGVLRTALSKNPLYNTLVGGLDAVVNILASNLLVPVTDTLYNRFLRGAVHEVGRVLTGNTDQAGILRDVGVLLNPWALAEAQTAIVTIDNFPKTIDFDLVVHDKYPVGTKFRFDFTSGTVYNEKDIPIRGFNGLFDIRKINVIKQGLVAGLIVDQVIDGSLLLNASFVDINDPLQVNVATNRRYKSDYSFVDLKLTSYTPQQDNAHMTTVSVTLAEIGNLNGIVSGIPLLSLIVSTVLNDIGTVSVSIPVYLPLLNVQNLQLTGGWAPPTTY